MKRLLAFLVSLSLVLTCLSGITLVAFAADLSAIGVSGEGTTASPFIIDTADKFIAVFGADATTTATTHAKGVVIYVTADIDLSDKSYSPNTAMFQGTLKGWDAANDVAAMRTINIGTATRTPIAGYISSSATKNVGGGVLGTAYNATFSHFTIVGTLTSAATDGVGAFVAYDDIKSSKYSYIVNRVNVTSSKATNTGGILGFARAGIDHCENHGTINGAKYTGGLIGAANSSGMTNSYCVNYGAVTGGNHSGGIMGSSYQSFSNCANFGDITGKGSTGGILGYHSQANTKMTNCFNAGTINYNATGVNNGCGSLVGRQYFSSSNSTPSRPINIENCYNIGAVIGSKDGLPYCTYASCVGDVQGTGSESYLKGTITGFYDLVNIDMPLYSVYNNLGGSATLTDAYVVGAEDGTNTATLTTMKALTSKTGSSFDDAETWEVDATKDYKFPTLVTNPYDDNLSAFDEGEEPEPEPDEPEEDYFVTNGISGAGTDANPYIIDTAAKFNAIFGSANTEWTETRSKVYHITSDIDLTEIAGGYIPWHASYSSFTGKILGKDANGNNVQRTIKIGTVGTESEPYTGIVGSANTMAGGLVAWASSAEISYLTVEGTLYADCKTGIGGVIGYIDGTASVSNVVNKVNVTGNYRVGGIGGTLTNTATVSNSVNEGTITNSGDYTGGILGMLYSANTVTNCTNNGAITSAGLCLGGIIGMTNNVATVSGCTNTGSVTATNATTTNTNAGIAGIVGEVNKAGSSIINCHNKGNITANNKALRGVGGITGWLEDSKIVGCSNTGDILGGARVGGITGYDRMSAVHDASTLGIHNSWNSGTIDSVTADATGGLAGFQWLNVTGISYSYTNNYNTGTIADATKSGSAIGAFYENTEGFVIDFTLSGFYDTTGMSVVVDDYRGRTAGNEEKYLNDPVLTNTYVYMGENLQEGATAINKTGLIGLTSSDDAMFKNTENWTPGSGTHPYPQIVNNPYTGYAVELPDDVVDSAYTVENIEVYYDNGVYKIKWDAETVADSYELHYGDETAVVTLNGDVTSIIKNKELEVQISAIKGSASYPSEATVVNGYYGGGSGVAGDEYLIYDAEQFANIEFNADAYYKQMGNFTVTTPLFLQEDKSLTYGKAVTWFDGYYNGNYNTITLDFTYNNTGDPAYALFTYIKNCTIENLDVDGSIVIEAAGEELYVGGIVGSAMSGSTYKIYNCNNYADITSNVTDQSIRVGGIMCISYQSSPTGHIKDCNNYGNLTAYSPAGIICRIRNKEIIENCANYGKLKGTNFAGGIVMHVEGGTITNCFNMGDVEGPTAAGIASYGSARYSNVSISNCFNAGTLSGDYTAGIARETAKYDGKTYTITNCYDITSAKYPIAHPYSGSALTVTNCYYVTPDGDEGSVTLEGLKEADLGDAFEISGTFPYPQLTSAPIDSDKAGVEFVTLTYDNDGNANIDRQTSQGYIVKGSEVIFYVESKDADFRSITVNANDILIDESIIEEKGIKYIVNDNTVISTTGVVIEAGTPEIKAGTNIIASTGDASITVDGTAYTRYAIAAGRAPKVAGLKLKEFGVLIQNKTGDFDIATARAKAQAASDRINENGAYGILIHGDGETGLKDNRTYYARPYAIYEDVNGEEVTAYGEIQSFVLATPVAAE